MATKKTKGRKRAKASGHNAVGVRLTPTMRAGLDELALESHTTRAAVMRQLIEHALSSAPEKATKR
jgi:predicted transcriptional regulator